MDQPVILCGLGRLGRRVLESLRAAGMSAVVIDRHCDPSSPSLKGVRVVVGDFRQADVLEAAGIREAGGILILTSEDLVNISAALTARQLNPKVRIVVRMFNQNLIPRLGKAVQNVISLSVSGMTAPLVALTALTGEALGAFSLEDGIRQVTEIKVTENSPLVGLTMGEAAARHHLLVVALSASGVKDHLWHDLDSDTKLVAGQQLVVCGEPEHLAPLLGVEADPLAQVRWAGWLRRNWRVIWRTLSEVDLPVKISTAILIGVLIAGTLVYYFGIPKSERTISGGLLRAVGLIATGGDLHENELDQPWQKVFVSALRIIGAALIAVFIAIITNYFLRARLGGALEVRRIPDAGHIVVCGLGNVGFRVVEHLLEYDERVVVIEQQRDSRFLATARRLGVPVIVGDATVTPVLRQAHAATARAVVAATDNDLVNLEIGLLARELNPRQRVVLRLYDTNLAQTLREAANIRLALSIPTLAAPAFVAALFGDRVPTIFLVCGRFLAVQEIAIHADDAALIGQSVRALAVDYKLLPVGLVSGNQYSNPRPADQILRPGDRLTVIAGLSDLERLLRREPLPADWAVEVSDFPAAARPKLTQLLWERQSITGHMAEGLLDHLPLRLGNNLTRGQAEDLLARVRQEKVVARLVAQSEALVSASQ
ncbi:MAG TPA: NAD-binding protein [Gemmataceae bacterium]|jgi:Trk K+ transport system NAD-binding subunit|nr:NAD-binding protein [Gemmataceae bacterium]